MDLTLSFGQRAILTGITVDVRKGVVTALIGPTGSGKTTLLRTFNRMNDKVVGYKHAGDVLLDGRSIWHPGVELMTLRRKVGMLFQRPNPFPMSIMDNVTAGARRTNWPAARSLRDVAEEHLTAVGLWRAVKDRLKDSPIPPVRRSAAVAVPGPGAGDQARDPAARRADLGAGPQRHGVHRGARPDAGTGYLR